MSPFDIDAFVKALETEDSGMGYFEPRLPQVLVKCARYVDTHPQAFADCQTREHKVARCFYLHWKGEIRFENEQKHG
jgi:hypothetical protein